jgi:hypothetical protein
MAAKDEPDVFWVEYREFFDDSDTEPYRTGVIMFADRDRQYCWVKDDRTGEYFRLRAKDLFLQSAHNKKIIKEFEQINAQARKLEKRAEFLWKQLETAAERKES